MKILSIDCGIKNLALCFLNIDQIPVKKLKIIQEKIGKIMKLDKNNEYKAELKQIYLDALKKTYKIYYWENINMFPIDSRLNSLKCDKEKCKSPVKYHKNYTIGFCTRHRKKTDMKGIREIKEKNSKLISYIDIGRGIVQNLDKFSFSGVEKIYIEQQPQKNSRMKNFQMMLFQYFVMRYPENINIQFVSPKYKLKNCGEFYNVSKKKTKYAQNKEVSIKKTYKILLESKNDKWYKYLINQKNKQDDFCDCFLQAINFN